MWIAVWQPGNNIIMRKNISPGLWRCACVTDYTCWDSPAARLHYSLHIGANETVYLGDFWMGCNLVVDFYYYNFFRIACCVSVLYLPGGACVCVCVGPCPWGLLFWFNSAPHGWTQSDTSEPVKGDAQWSWSYTTAAAAASAAPRRKRPPASQTVFTRVDAAETPNSGREGKTKADTDMPNCSI